MTARMSDEWSELSNQVSILCDGWSERREFAVRAGLTTEVRIESVTHPGLLVQLRTLTHPIVRAKQEGGSGGKAGTKPPGAFEAASLIDEVGRYAHSVRVDWCPEREPLRTTVGRTLLLLQHTARMRTEVEVRDVSWHLKGFVRQARVVVGHDVPTRAFADTVCGNCGGELRVPMDGAGPVFCAGKPSASACGTKYGRNDWIRLALDMEAARGAEAGGFGTGSDLLDDAAPA